MQEWVKQDKKKHTCDDEAFIVFQSFSKKARHNKFRVDEEPDFFLDQSMSCNPTTYKPVCKVHLIKQKIKIKIYRNIISEWISLFCQKDFFSVLYFLAHYKLNHHWDIFVSDTKLVIVYFRKSFFKLQKEKQTWV